ncbi:MAG: ribonuclease H-like domain-containing protein [Anaerolineae bacterium]|nr:ribonuclease H-like domain-containing protein [Anaerolineae bacterium]
MNGDWQEKLRRLGVTKGTRDLKVPPRPPRMSLPSRRAETTLEQLFPNGDVVENGMGTCFVIDTVYPVQHTHGQIALGDVRTCDAAVVVPYTSAELSDVKFGRCLFFDVETTGLAGAGAWAHTISAGFFSGDTFVTRQFFARDPGEESAVLHAFTDLTADPDRVGLVTFNGRSFDVPLVQNRYFMNRMRDPLSDLPNFDLMLPARRLWHRRLGSYSLHALENAVLGLERSAMDIEGYLIPLIYAEFVRSGDATDIQRMLYRNRIDLMSMVVLTTHIVRAFADYRQLHEPLDLLSLAKWQAQLGLWDSAEANLRYAASLDCDIEQWHAILLELGAVIKRRDRRAEAVPLWQQVAHTSSQLTPAHVELAKYYEWHDRDLAQALHWTQAAQALVPARDWIQRQALAHRAERLLRKLESENDS